MQKGIYDVCLMRRKGRKMNYYTMYWVCHDGSLARAIIPETVDDDDLLAIREFYDVITKRHFKKQTEVTNDE